MESELGAKLFERDNRTVKLTQSGEKFKQFSEQFLSGYKQIKQELKALDAPLYGHIKIYCSVTASLSLLPSILDEFRSKNPYIEIKIETGAASLALNKIKQKEADLSIAALPKIIPHGIFALELAKIPLVFIAPKQIPISWLNNGEISWSTLPYIVSEQGELRNEMDQWFDRHKIKPNIYAEISGNEAIVSMVSLGMGIALIPEVVVQNSSSVNKVQIIDRPFDVLPFRVSLCVLETLLKDDVIKAFIDLSKNKNKN